jgi:lipoprotein-anchoring transpeptidase ErfK/SrfK
MARPMWPTRRIWWRQLGVIASVVIASVLVLSVTAACGGAEWQSPGAKGDSTPETAPTEFVVSHAADAKDVSPADPVTVAIKEGTLESVTLANAGGKQVAGEFDAGKTAWKSSEDLGYGKTYTLTIVGVGPDGRRGEDKRSFSTIKPKNFALPYLRANVATLLDKGTFGVGQPIVVWFDEPIKDKAAAERTLTVTTDPPVVGAWYWLDSREVHWRPKEYWPAGTKVEVEVEVYGKDLGGGVYGQENRKASFTIGRSKIAIADSNTKHMKIYIDGKQVTTINGIDVTQGVPISMGKTGTEQAPNGTVVDFRTHSGPHVVTTKHEVYHMTSASYGIIDPASPNYYDEEIKKSIRISGDGEFLHLADWNIPAHGVENTSHGCVNIAPSYIFWIYDTFGAGDIVDVRNTGKNLDVRNGLGDWMLSWEQWQKGSALTT